MNTFLIIPGLGSSDPDHWQTHLQNDHDNFLRVQQDNWDAPDCLKWTNKIEVTIKYYNPREVVLIGHSLGCATIVHWAKRFKTSIKGALLVAPSDVEAMKYNFPITGFSPIPLDKLGFKSFVVASENDEWVSLERAFYFAQCWGSEFINLGNAGHINIASGHGKWPEAIKILDLFNG